MNTTINFGQILGVDIIPMDDIPPGFKRTEGQDIYVNARNYEYMKTLTAFGMILAVGCLKEVKR